jgi:hypothetical protein
LNKKFNCKCPEVGHNFQSLINLTSILELFKMLFY